MDYKDTVNLPKTSFPMKANLGKLEQELLRRWEQEHIYQQLRQKYADRAKYILHDGPPYANGNIHLGTAFNKILKDFVVRVKGMEGYNAVYVPGWDCHGLPIEHQVDLELGDAKAGMSKADIRRRFGDQVFDDYDRYLYLVSQLRDTAYDPGRGRVGVHFAVQDVLFNAILLRADEDLRTMAVTLGERTDEIEDWISHMRSNFNTRFWDEGTGLYYDYDLKVAEPIRVNTASTFVPLFAGVPSETQAQRLVDEHLLNPAEYAPAGDVSHWVTTTARTEPAWEARRYWRGPVWIIMNWLLIEGLLRYGYNDLANLVRQNTLALIESAGFREYYDARDGSGCGSSDFSWSAALALELAESHSTAE